MDYIEAIFDEKFIIFKCFTPDVSQHSHKFIELVYVVSGRANHVFDGVRSEIKTGDYFFIDYCSTHSYRALSDDFAVLNCLILPELIDSSLVHCESLTEVLNNYQIHFDKHFFTSNPAGIIFHDEDGFVGELLAVLMREYTNKENGYRQIIRARIIELLVLVMRRISKSPENTCENDEIFKVMNYINQNFKDEITLEKLCEISNYSLPYLSKKFKESTGVTYSHYLQQMRINESMRLLVNTNLPINLIAEKVGYRDIKSFYQKFKKFTNTTPSNFRKTKQGT